MWKWLVKLFIDSFVMGRVEGYYQHMPMPPDEEFSDVINVWIAQFTHGYTSTVPRQDFDINEFKDQLCLSLAIRPEINKVTSPVVHIEGDSASFEFKVFSPRAAPDNEVTIKFMIDEFQSRGEQ